MPLPLSELTQIAEMVAREHHHALMIEGVMFSNGRAELLVTVRGCHADPCTLLLNLSRQDHELWFD